MPTRMTTYTEARYNRLHTQIEESGFTLYELDTEDLEPHAVYRLNDSAALPEVTVYALDGRIRVAAADWHLDLNLEVPPSVVTTVLLAASR